MAAETFSDCLMMIQPAENTNTVPDRKVEGYMIIRVAKTEDAGQIADIYRPYVENTAVSFEYTAPGKDEMAGRIEETLKNYPYLAAEEDGEILGYAYTGRYKERKAYDWAAEISIYIKEEYHGKGAGRALYTAIEKISAMQNILNLYACITVENTDEETAGSESAKFHEHMGYKPAGRFCYSGNKFGKWHSTVFMEKLIGEHPDSPPEIIPFPELDKCILKEIGVL